MAEAKGFKAISFVDGGSANRGEDTSTNLRLSNGEKEFEQTFFVSHDKRAMSLMALVHFGGMGSSVTEPGNSVLTLQVDAQQGLMNFYLAADRETLTKLRDVCTAALDNIQSSHREPSRGLN